MDPGRTERPPDRSVELPRSLGGDEGSGATTYEVTYAFDSLRQGEYREMIDRANEALSSLRAEGVDIEFRGATLRVDGAGRVVTVTARFAAQSQGAVGRLNCRGMLPASGVRRLGS